MLSPQSLHWPFSSGHFLLSQRQCPSNTRHSFFLQLKQQRHLPLFHLISCKKRHTFSLGISLNHGAGRQPLTPFWPGSRTQVLLRKTPYNPAQPSSPRGLWPSQCGDEDLSGSGKEGLAQLRLPGPSLILQSSQCISSFKRKQQNKANR